MLGYFVYDSAVALMIHVQWILDTHSMRASILDMRYVNWEDNVILYTKSIAIEILFKLQAGINFVNQGTKQEIEC